MVSGTRSRQETASSVASDSSTVFTSATPSLGSGYTTPLTSNSATPTPAESLVKPGSSRPLTRIEVHLPSAKPPTRSLRQSIYSMGSKRKRDVVDDSQDEDDDFSDNSPDAILARKLQAQEDATSSQLVRSQPPPRPGPVARRGMRSDAPAATGRTARVAGLRSDGNEATSTTPRSAIGANRPAPTRAASSGEPAAKKTAIYDTDDPDYAFLRPADDDSDDDSDDALDSDAIEQLWYHATGIPPRRKGPAVPTRRRGTKGADAAPARVPDSDEEDGESSWDEYISDDVYSLEEEDEPGDADQVAGQTGLGDADVVPPRGALQRAMENRRAYRAYASTRRVRKDRSRLEQHHPELTTMWTELESMPILKAGKAKQPTSISRQLKPFQLEGLAWMTAMEKTDWKGGLLGDEMGLGKTIQAVSLIMSDFPAKKPSLVLVPPVALMQWMTEIESYTDGTLKTLVFHGTNSKSKNLTVKDIKKYDVIIMSYNSLESVYRKQEKGFKRKDGLFKEKSIIHQTDFHRIILDEAHCIKTRSTMTAKACFALKVTYRWCLSGTPLQNRIGEFFSLIRFLNVRPFACYLCKSCPCSTMEWQMDDDNRCTGCGHGAMQHVSVFNQELLNPIQKYGNKGQGAEAFKKLRILTDRIMLRRLKKDHTDSMELPVKEINVERQFFGEEENDFANSIMTSGQRKFDTYVASGVLLNNYANIFGLIMQMRQVADHPDLILKKNSEGGQNILVCSICDEPAEDAIRSRCKHDFCRTCVKSYLNSTTDPNCPRCHIPLSIDLEQPEMEQDEVQVKQSSIINRIKMENWTSSSKIELLVHELHKLRSDNASHKSIIFSQFTTMLQLIEWRLRRAGITTVMLDGSMSPAQRQASITHFMTNVDVEVFLVSLKAGGVALNLTEASRVFIVDPWWNPAA